jgi:hypothetical protein
MGMPDILGMGPGGPEGEGPEVESQRVLMRDATTTRTASANWRASQ